MKPLLKLLAIALMIGAASACSQHPKKPNTENSNDRSDALAYTNTLSFLSLNDDTLATIQIAVADDENERSEGLMDVNRMPQDNGMLFIFDKQQPLSFWMANTPLPLDIIFVNKEKRIVRIHHSTTPFTEKNFPSGQPALYAIETNGGFTIAHDIQEGIQVDWK